MSVCCASRRGGWLYFPFDMDRTFWEVLCADHLKVMRNAVLWANNEAPAVEVDGPGLLDVTAWKKRKLRLRFIW